jgi:hypothetical protein
VQANAHFSRGTLKSVLWYLHSRCPTCSSRRRRSRRSHGPASVPDLLFLLPAIWSASLNSAGAHESESAPDLLLLPAARPTPFRNNFIKQKLKMLQGRTCHAPDGWWTLVAVLFAIQFWNARCACHLPCHQHTSYVLVLWVSLPETRSLPSVRGFAEC